MNKIIEEWKETVKLFGKRREVTITIKAEADPNAIRIIETIDLEYPIEKVLNDYKTGELSIDIICVEVKCDLFTGTDCLRGCFIEPGHDHGSEVECCFMVEQAINEYKKNAQKHKEFFISLFLIE